MKKVYSDSISFYMYHLYRDLTNCCSFFTGLYLTINNIVAHLAIPATTKVERAVEVVVALGQRTPHQLQEHFEYLIACAVAYFQRSLASRRRVSHHGRETQCKTIKARKWEKAKNELLATCSWFIATDKQYWIAPVYCDGILVAHQQARRAVAFRRICLAERHGWAIWTRSE